MKHSTFKSYNKVISTNNDYPFNIYLINETKYFEKQKQIKKLLKEKIFCNWKNINITNSTSPQAIMLLINLCLPLNNNLPYFHILYTQRYYIRTT